MRKLWQQLHPAQCPLFENRWFAKHEQNSNRCVGEQQMKLMGHEDIHFFHVNKLHHTPMQICAILCREATSNLGSCENLENLIWTKPWQATWNSESEVLVVKTTETFFIPKVSPIVERVIFCARTTETKVGGTDNSDAHASLEAAKGGRSGVQPFFTEERSNALEGVDCIRAKHKGTKVWRCS